MKRLTVFACLSMAMIFAVAAVASDSSTELKSYNLGDGKYAQSMTGDVVWQGKAKADTVYIIGGPGGTNGDFEDAGGAPDDDNWTSEDATQKTVPIWNVNVYHAANLDPGTVPNHAWWCGEDWPSCGPGDPDGGYGNGYNEYLDYVGTMPNATIGATVTVDAMLNYDNEPGYDYLYLEYSSALGMQAALTFNGKQDSVVVNTSFSLAVGDYGAGGTFTIRWHFQSDGGWSDEDCSWATEGGAQVDLMVVTVDQGGGPIILSSENNEGPSNDYVVNFPPGVGDFAKVWPRLDDIDPCRSNNTPVFAFIDDGLVVPGTGGYLCTTWCYGPGGYIVTPEGGLAGPDFHIENYIMSPPVAWPGPAYDGAEYRFAAYRHESLASGGTAPGVFYVWGVRSTIDPSVDPLLIDPDSWSGWLDRNFVYYGGPDWLAGAGDVVTDLMEPGRTWVQVRIGVYELGYVWGYVGTDGYPAPYFDDVRFSAFEFGGPGISTREIDIFNDGFPEILDVDYLAPGNNSVRFDMARSISLAAHLINDAGDSSVWDVVAVRTGSFLNDRPRLYYKLFPNTLFDPYRTSGLPNEGWVYGDTTRTGTGTIVADRFNFDLPDTGFFWPGDVIHYYIWAQDNQGGSLGTTLLPGDTTGFAMIDEFPNYSSSYTVHALPTVKNFTTKEQPSVLFLNDFANRGGESEWYYALRNLGFRQGADYDVYYTNGPSSGIGDGIGRWATAQIDEYDVILYTSGDLGAFTICNGDPNNDVGNDVGVLDGWLQLGGKSMFLTGDDLVFDLQASGTATLAFLNTWIGVNYVAQDINPLIGGQAAPTVVPLPGNPVFTGGISQWIAYGGCLGFNTFDAVTVAGVTVPLAEFLDPGGLTGQYTFAAATLNVNVAATAEVIYMPYDLMYVYSQASGSLGGISARAEILAEVMLHFGISGGSPVVGLPDAGVFAIKNYPNPFNPNTKIEYSLPKAGSLEIAVFNARGQLVKTLINKAVQNTTGHVIWDGTNSGGDKVASGVYFYQTMLDGVKKDVSKMVLVK